MKFSVLFAVGANCVRPRAFTERPYEDDFLSVGKTCFMEGTPSRTLCYKIAYQYYLFITMVSVCPLAATFLSTVIVLPLSVSPFEAFTTLPPAERVIFPAVPDAK